MAGCGGTRSANVPPVRISLNAGAIVYLVNIGQQAHADGQSRLRLDNAAVAGFAPPDSIHITARQADASPRRTPYRYDIAFTQENHIARARVTATTQPGLDINAPTVQRFNEALSRALTTYALKDRSDGGITSVYITNGFLIIDVQAPLQ